MFSDLTDSIRVHPFAGAHTKPADRYAAVKRWSDVLVVLATAPVSLPVIVVLAFAVWLSGGKPFYSQPRVGRNGRLFTLWKLRTMIADGDRRLQEHLAQSASAQTEWNETQKLRQDPRVTRLGRQIRKYSLDELPQLWNVFVGDMSLVGPRPMLPEQRTLYPGTAYFQMRPGLTGLWQVSARNESAFAARALYDSRYADMMSLGADLWIMLLSVRVVFRGTGC